MSVIWVKRKSPHALAGFHRIARIARFLSDAIPAPLLHVRVLIAKVEADRFSLRGLPRPRAFIHYTSAPALNSFNFPVAFRPR